MACHLEDQMRTLERGTVLKVVHDPTNLGIGERGIERRRMGECEGNINRMRMSGILYSAYAGT